MIRFPGLLCGPDIHGLQRNRRTGQGGTVLEGIIGRRLLRADERDTEGDITRTAAEPVHRDLVTGTRRGVKADQARC